MKLFENLSAVVRLCIISFVTLMFVVLVVSLFLWSSLPSKAGPKKSAALAVGQVRVTDADLARFAGWSDRDVFQALCPTLMKKVEDKDMKDKALATAAWVSCARHFEHGAEVSSSRTDVLRAAITLGCFKGQSRPQ